MYRTLAFLVLTIDGVFGFIVRSALFSKSINDPLFVHRAKSRRIPRLLQATTMSTSNSTPEEASKQTKTVEVVVVGSCNTDLMTYTPRLPSQGETVIGSRFETLYGGKGANQAVMASRMGAKVAMVGCLGKDSFGAGYTKRLEDEGINCSCMCHTQAVATGVAQICVEDVGGANSIVVVPGANFALSTKDVASAAEKLNGARVMMCQAEVLPEVTLEALERGRAAGMMTLFNPAPAQVDIPDRFLQLSDLLCPNETELALLCKGNVDPENDESVFKGARELIGRGAKVVVVTLGSRGCMLVSSSSDGYRRFEAEKVDAVDTVGAGDAFLGSLGAYLARGVALEDAIQGAVSYPDSHPPRRAAKLSTGLRIATRASNDFILKNAGALQHIQTVGSFFPKESSLACSFVSCTGDSIALRVLQ